MRKMIILVFAGFQIITAQGLYLSGGYGKIKYDHNKATTKNSIFFESSKEWLIYNLFTFDFSVGYLEQELFLQDVIIYPLYTGNPVVIYNNDLFIKIKYIETPLRLGIKAKVYKNFYIKPYIGFALDFALRTNINIINKQLLYEGFPYDSGLIPDFSTSEELKEQNYHTTRNSSLGMDIGYKRYSLGLLIKRFPPPLAFGRLTKFDKNIYGYYFTLRVLLF